MTRSLAIAVCWWLASACSIVGVDGHEHDEETLAGGVETRLDAVVPAQGSLQGGTAVIVRGEDLPRDAAVFFGDVPAAEVRWVDAKTLSVTTPAAARAGIVDVSVRSRRGRTFVLRRAFEFLREHLACKCNFPDIDPGFDARRVPVVGPLHIRWPVAIDVASVSERVELRQLGGDALPIDIRLADSQTVEVVPRRSMRFWESYGLSVAQGVRTRLGARCSGGSVAFSTWQPREERQGLRPAAALDADLAGSHLIVASRKYRGLQTYDLSNPARPRLVSDHLIEEGPGPNSLVVFEDRAYATAAWNGLMIFDVSDPTRARMLGRGGTPGYARDVAVFRRQERIFAAVADGPAGVRILDVTDPLQTSEVAAIQAGEDKDAEIFTVDVQGARLVASAGGDGVLLADIDDVTAPRLLGVIDTVSFAIDAVLQRDVVYVGLRHIGVRSYSIADPAAPELVDGSTACGDGCTPRAGSLAIRGQDLFAVNGARGFARFRLLGDGVLELAEWVDASDTFFVIKPLDERVLVGGESGLRVHSCDPACDTQPEFFDENGHGAARSVVVTGGHAYVAARKRGLQTFDLSNPLHPKLVDRDDTLASPFVKLAALGLSLVEDQLLVADGRAGVAVFDIATPSNPRLREGNLAAENSDLIDLTLAAARKGAFAFACNGNVGFFVIDLRDPDRPVVVARVPFWSTPVDLCYDMEVANSLLYVGTRNGLSTFDISDPAAPALLHMVAPPTGETVRNIVALERFLLVSGSTADVEVRSGRRRVAHVFDLSDPAAPEHVWRSEELGGAGHAVVVGDKAFLAGGSEGVHVFDVFDPSSPVREGTIRVSGHAAGLARGSETLYVAQQHGGLTVVRTGRLPH